MLGAFAFLVVRCSADQLDDGQMLPLSRPTRGTYPAPVYHAEARSVDISSPMPSSLQTPSDFKPNPVYPPPSTTTTPPHHKLIVGNWIAQWDTKYRAWFYYNINTEKSTWVKPIELNHVTFKNPDIKRNRNQNSVDSNAYGYRRPYKRPYSANGNRRILVESDTDEFFGLNTTVFKNEGFLSGLTNKMTGYYTDTAKDYVADLYDDALEGYLGGTIQLVGWFLFGSASVLMNEFMSAINTKRSFDNPTLTDLFSGRGVEDEDGNMSYTLPFMEDLLGIPMTFPIDNSLAGCYKERESCVNKDFPAEVDHLLENMVAVKDFFWKWLELSEKIGHMVEEGEEEL